MTASLNQVLLAFWRQMDVEKNWGRRAGYGLLLAGLVAALWFMPDMRARLIVICCVLAIAVVGFWLALFINLMQQNQPNAARLVPGHLRRLRQAVLLSWLLPSAVLGVLIWLATMPITSLPLLLLAAAVGVFCMAWAQRYWLVSLLMFMAPAFTGPLHLQQRLAPLGSTLVDAWRVQPWGWLALGLALMGWLLTRMFGTGDAGHRAYYERRQRMQNIARAGMTGNRQGLALFGRPGQWLGWPSDAVNAAWLARLLRQARPRQASVMARAEVVLHGLQHWVRQLLNIILTAACMAVGVAIACTGFGIPLDAMLDPGAFSIAMGLGCIGFNPSFALFHMLWHTRREQALLALLPGMPQGQALNRALAAMQLRHFLLGWALTTLLVLGLVLLVHRPAMLSPAIAGLPLGILSLLRAPARLRALTPWSVTKPVLGFMLLAGVLWSLCTWLDGLVWPLAGISLALSAALLAWRWRVISQAPSALPAGHAA